MGTIDQLLSVQQRTKEHSVRSATAVSTRTARFDNGWLLNHTAISNEGNDHASVVLADPITYGVDAQVAEDIEASVEQIKDPDRQWAEMYAAVTQIMFEEKDAVRYDIGDIHSNFQIPSFDPKYVLRIQDFVMDQGLTNNVSIYISDYTPGTDVVGQGNYVKTNVGELMTEKPSSLLRRRTGKLVGEIEKQMARQSELVRLGQYDPAQQQLIDMELLSKGTIVDVLEPGDPHNGPGQSRVGTYMTVLETLGIESHWDYKLVWSIEHYTDNDIYYAKHGEVVESEKYKKLKEQYG